MKQSQFQEKYLKNPKVPVNIPFFWYVLSIVLIVLMVIVMIIKWTA